MRIPTKPFSAIPVVCAVLVLAGCGGGGGATVTPTSQATPVPTPQPTPSPNPTPSPTAQPTPTPSGGIANDDALFKLISIDEPFGAYVLFPNTTEISSGRLDGAGAHPMARVRLSRTAFQSLENGRLPPGGRFRSGSVIVKEIPSQNLLAVMRRSDEGATGAGWQWAEFRTDGTVAYSMSGRGGACIECHSRQQGPQNDLVRTFERQQ